MKRYRLCNFFLDTSRNIFKHPAGKLEKIKQGMQADLVSVYGSLNIDEKFTRYMEVKKPAISIIAEHTHLLEDICKSYVQGNLYSALTGACCLGERIFNNIIFKVMDDFKSSKHYKDVYDRGSIIDWARAIRILSDWKIIDKETKEKYLELYKLRTDSVHYQKKEQNLIAMSLNAINIINFIINKLFGVGPHRKDILLYFDAPGEIFIKKEAEGDPMVKAFYIPCCALVGPRFKMESGDKLGQFKIVDLEYKKKEISDDEFVQLRKEFKG